VRPPSFYFSSFFLVVAISVSKTKDVLEFDVKKNKVREILALLSVTDLFI
jgi:hypothetical protein